MTHDVTKTISSAWPTEHLHQDNVRSK